MFYTKKHRNTVELLYSMLQDQRVLIANLQGKLENHINTHHPHGTKKDGTPRAKPGRKTT
jgi:hypothetical protein